MDRLHLHEFHEGLGARFTDVNGKEAVSDYGDWRGEHEHLLQQAGVLDLSFRSRICLAGADRVRFLHGQVTNDIKTLQPGTGCYAALVTAKGKMQSDLNVYCLAQELLLDFEPGLTSDVCARLEKYIVADDVQLVDVAAQYELISIQGPQSIKVAAQLELFPQLPTTAFTFCALSDPTLGDLYLMNQPRLGTAGFDVYVPAGVMEAVTAKAIAAAKNLGGGPCGWQALEAGRIEAGIPRFGLDMNETNLPQECGIEGRALSYNKGCYIGQEVLNRIHTMGHVNRQLCGLKIAAGLKTLPQKGDKLFFQGRETGFLTSVLVSRRLGTTIALGCLRRETSKVGTELVLRTADQESTARVVELPFRPD
jgi:folate-binding protein YgfZ